MVCLVDMPVEIVNIILKFLFSNVQIDCDKGHFGRRLGCAASIHLFAVLEICKGLFTARQVQDAMLSYSIIRVCDTWDLVHMDKFFQPEQRNLIHRILLATAFFRTADLSNLYTGTLSSFKDLSVLEIDTGVNHYDCLLEHRTEIFNHLENTNGYVKRYIDPKCFSKGEHGAWVWTDLNVDTRIAKDVERAFRRDCFTYHAQIADRAAIDSALFPNHFEKKRTEEIATLITQADKAGIEIKTKCSVNLSLENNADLHCDCEWDIHEASFSSNDLLLRLKLGDREILIPQEFGEWAPIAWQERPHIHGDGCGKVAPKQVQSANSKIDPVDESRERILKLIEEAKTKWSIT